MYLPQPLLPCIQMLKRSLILDAELRLVRFPIPTMKHLSLNTIRLKWCNHCIYTSYEFLPLQSIWKGESHCCIPVKRKQSGDMTFQSSMYIQLLLTFANHILLQIFPV